MFRRFSVLHSLATA